MFAYVVDSMTNTVNESFGSNKAANVCASSYACGNVQLVAAEHIISKIKSYPTKALVL